jgi:hypothetical protein
MAKPKPPASFLQVPDCSKKEEFLSAARKVWKEHHPENCGKPGRRSNAERIFEACDDEMPKIVSKRMSQMWEIHINHVTDSNDAFPTWWDCDKCDEMFLQASVWEFRKAVEKNLTRKFEEISNGKHVMPEKKALARHITAWLRLKLHPEWLVDGIPKAHRNLPGCTDSKKFDDGHVKAYNKRRLAHFAEIEAIKTSNMTKAQKEESIGYLATEPLQDARMVWSHFRDPYDPIKRTKQSRR